MSNNMAPVAQDQSVAEGSRPVDPSPQAVCVRLRSVLSTYTTRLT